jgi:iron complex outermembrane receptor protein
VQGLAVRHTLVNPAGRKAEIIGDFTIEGGCLMKRFGIAIFLLATLALHGLAACWAEEEATEVIKLQQLVVSAPRTDKMLVDVPASISIITAEEIEEMGAKNIVDVVENIPGVVKDSDSRSRVTFRGNRSSQSAGVLVLVDGVPANTGISGYVEYEAIPLADIERVEVVRSSAAILYGPDASRGVINIVTKQGKEGRPQLTASASYGSWATWEESAGVLGRFAELDYALTASRLDTDGYEDDQTRRTAARLNAGYNFSDETRLGFNFGWRDIDYETIYGKTKWEVEKYRRDSIFPTSETNPTLKHHRENEDQNNALSLQLDHDGEALFIKSFVSYDNTDHRYEYLEKELDPSASKTSSSYDYREDQDQDRLLASVSGGYRFKFGQIDYTPTIGADYEDIDYDQKKTYPWSPEPYSASQVTSAAKGTMDSERQRWGVFLHNEFDMGEQWELDLSGRVDDVEYDVKTKEPRKVQNDDTNYSWDVTPAFHPVSNSTIYASVSRSYWYPVLQYYKYAMEYGDEDNRAEDLSPEEYLTYEVGYKHYFGPALGVALAAYYTKVSDKFLSLYDESTWKGYRNVGDSKDKGIELEASGRLCPYFGYRLLAAYQDAEWDDATFRCYAWGETPAEDTLQNVDISGKTVPQIPKFTSTIGLDFYFADYFKLSTDMNYYGERYIDVLNRYERDDYVTFDAMLSYTRANYRIWILGNNLFDNEVENEFNEQGKRNADDTPGHLYYPLDGRYIETGVTITF